MQINDEILRVTGGPTINDGLLAYYQLQLYGTPLPLGWQYLFTVGTDAVSAYGYSLAVYGDLVPPTIGGIAVNTLIADSGTDLVSLSFAAGAQVGGLTTIDISVEGYDSNPVTLTWNVNQYEVTDADLAAFIVAANGTDLGLSVAPAILADGIYDLHDAEYAFLVGEGATPGQLNDMWYEFLGGTGELNDLRLAYWAGL